MDIVNQSNNILHTTRIYITYVPVTTQWFIIKYEDMFPSLLKSFNIKKKQSCSYSITCTCTRATSQYSILHAINRTIFCLKSFKTHAIQFGDAYQIHFNLQNFELCMLYEQITIQCTCCMC